MSDIGQQLATECLQQHECECPEPCPVEDFARRFISEAWRDGRAIGIAKVERGWWDGVS